MPLPHSNTPALRHLLLALCSMAFIAASTTTFAAEPAPKSAKTSPSGVYIGETIEKLYGDYETIDSNLSKIERRPAASSFSGGAVLVPITVTIKKSGKFSLDYVEVSDDGLPLWGHVYTGNENTAMDKGGRHFLCRTETAVGKHTISVEYVYTISDGEKPEKKQSAWTYKAEKDPVVIEILLERTGKNVVAKPGILRVTEGK